MLLIDVIIWKVFFCEKLYCFVDGGGMYFEVFLLGGKYWWFKYCFVGKEKCLVLGVYFDVLFVVVWEKWDEVRKIFVGGVDFGEVKKVEKWVVFFVVINLFEVVVLGWMEECKFYVILGLWGKIKVWFVKDVFFWLGKCLIVEIDVFEVLIVFKCIDSWGVWFIVYKVCSEISWVFCYGIKEGYCKVDVVCDLIDVILLV